MDKVKKKTTTTQKKTRPLVKKSSHQKRQKANHVRPSKEIPNINAHKKKKKQSKKQKEQLKKRKRNKVLMEISMALVISAFLIWLIMFLTIAIPKVDGYSMTPTTNDRDRMLVNKWAKIKRLNLIYFKEPRKDEKMIRRVIGLPGDTLFYKDGQLFVNGNEVAERFLSDTYQLKDQEQTMPDFTLQEILNVNSVPNGKYFVLGDNRAYATDSRYFGFVDEKDIVGVVKIRLFPIHSMTHF
ncbi:hypothetical protein ATZ33_14675 [Enterococcus silesiacus]|uniref:Signal peptidase I n=1 Tax=Enterococcus silesiacus TaxID=332949 RepID=A0A0S3KE39_9ENTE|nr:signal peptidase I [Enterococcus silesiacus]ALS02576.1 hypothetical protein ATZ33_14675 [Enterococcus silesiacus]OJG93503.1 signal peptidase I [Enterococcus silesiacus]